jgi:hypothetical protein
MSAVFGLTIYLINFMEMKPNFEIGIYALLASTLLIIADYALADTYNQSFFALLNSGRSDISFISLLAVVFGIWGICVMAHSLITRQWRISH